MNETPENKPVMGAPRKEVNWDDFDSLCQMHATEVEFCYFFDMCEDTLNARCKEKFNKTFSEVFKERSVGGRMSLRRSLWQSAMGDINAGVKPNLTAQIFLSKQPEERGGLGFSDKVTNEVAVGNGTYEQLLGLCKKLEEDKKAE
jgi:hypothetical protein